MLLILALYVYVLGEVRANSTVCERAPLHAQPADAHYKIGVAGDPDLFLPGELYTVSLQGVDSGQGPTPFVGFVIWAEVVDESENQSANSTRSPNSLSYGAFQAYDAQTKSLEVCKPAVDNATAHPKTEVQVIWTAPSILVDSCVRICGRASDADGTRTSVLARKLCPAPITTVSLNRQPTIVEPCCACDEAKYEVTFEGLWSRNTHARDFPPESAHAHFSDVIGASHTAQYRVWQEGRIASNGVRRLAEDGTTTAMEKELKAESDHIRTIIKARGLSWQQVAAGGGPTTFAVFRVDAKNHLVSLASKLAPSPDWIVGVSALELCNANCTWRRSFTLPLYPYDAGTDNGISYMSRRSPTIPPSPVRALRPEWPKDSRSPFYSSTGEMRPFARLRLSRLRLYEKSCEVPEVRGEKLPEIVVSTAGGSCATHAWGGWGPCSVTCGPGRSARQRHYMWPVRAKADSCRAVLTEYKDCNGPRLHCRIQSDYEPEAAESNGPCAVSPWSEWSACAASGCGVRARTRHYLVARAHKRCHVGFRARTEMSQAMPCQAGPCDRPPGSQGNSTNLDWFFIDRPRPDCPVTEWGGWSPCSSRCSRGRRIRTRLYISQNSDVQKQLTKTLLRGWNLRFAELQNLELPYENMTSGDEQVDTLVQEHLDRCQFTMTQQEALCDGEDNNCENQTISEEICKLPMSVGHCRAYEERWFYDAERSTCEPFGYTGCGGNANNFKNREACQQTCCNHNTTETSVTSTLEVITKRIKPTPSNEDNEVMLNDAPVPEVNCEMGAWLGWSECFGDCKFAVKLNYRHIVRPPSGSGKPCHKVIKSRLCKPLYCKRNLLDFTNSSDTNNVDIQIINE